jgi:hypothetical protein
MNRFSRIDLKMPELKMPMVLVDVFYDIRDRHLLPFVALILVALVAVPFLLSSSGSGPAGEPVTPVAGESTAAAAQLTVVETDHGLREPDKRLAARSAKDPFLPQFTGPAGGGEAVSQTSTTSTTTSIPATSGSGSVTTETESPGGGGGGSAETAPPTTETPPSEGGSSSPPITVFTFAVDLKIVKSVPKKGGGTTRSKPETREGVLPPTTLPGKKTQVLTYIGISAKDEMPLFMVSPEVSSVFGEAQCVSGAGSCQLIELEPNFPVTLVYGPNDVRYKFTVLKVKPVKAGQTSGHS